MPTKIGKGPLTKAAGGGGDQRLREPLLTLRSAVEGMTDVHPGSKQEASGPLEADVEMAAALFGYYRRPDCLDVNLSPRAIQVLAGMLLAKEPAGIHIADLQFVLETEAGALIPSQSLYPLVEALVARGFITGRAETGSRGRPRSFYRLTYAGRAALEVARNVAEHAVRGEPQGSDRQ